MGIRSKRKSKKFVIRMTRNKKGRFIWTYHFLHRIFQNVRSNQLWKHCVLDRSQQDQRQRNLKSRLRHMWGRIVSSVWIPQRQQWKWLYVFWESDRGEEVIVPAYTYTASCSVICHVGATPLPEAKSYLMKHGMNPDKYHVVTNGIALEEWQNPQDLPPYIEDHFRKMLVLLL